MHDFDPVAGLVRSTVSAIGYHTRLAEGTAVHPTRESLDHAAALLDAEDPAGWAVAQRAIRLVLDLQVVDPTQATYGIWPWFAEEPVERMGPPDWNWADFIGARLMEMLVRRGDRLPSDLAEAMRTALGHAAWSIFRRNVGPGYTNIALMGAAVALVAGELLGEPRLVAYAAARFRACADHYAWVGGLTEYNSPTYTVVALEEVERALRLGRDARALAEAARLQRLVWETIAEHWHAPTGQWAGPHSRTYHDLQQPAVLALIAAKTGAPGGEAAHDWVHRGPPCPADLAARFSAVQPGEIRRRFHRDAADPRRDVWGTSWMDGRACLGSISGDTTWTQRRPLLGYWRGADGAIACLRLRVLKDGRDFASGMLRCAQRGPRALAAVGLVTDSGDWHPTLDRPADGVFAGGDLRVRIQLAAPGAQAVDRGAGAYALRAGDGEAVVRAMPSTVDGAALRWVVGGDGDAAWIDGILPVAWPLRLRSLAECVCAVGISLSGDPGQGPESRIDGGVLELAWNGLGLRVPLAAGPQSAVV